MEKFKVRLFTLSFLMIFSGISFYSCNDDNDNDITSDAIVENLPDISGYPIVGTNQSTAYDNTTIINTPSEDDDYYGQNANHPGTTPSYTDNGDGTITDNVTGLMWQSTLDHNGDGDASEYSSGHGPQGDAVRILNYVRLVRNVN